MGWLVKTLNIYLTPVTLPPPQIPPTTVYVNLSKVLPLQLTHAGQQVGQAPNVTGKWMRHHTCPPGDWTQASCAVTQQCYHKTKRSGLARLVSKHLYIPNPTTIHMMLLSKKIRPQRHKTFEYSQENSQLKYPSPRIGGLNFFKVFTYVINVKDIFNSTILRLGYLSWEFPWECSKALWRWGLMYFNLLPSTV
jgi:hypothetical protein